MAGVSEFNWAEADLVVHPVQAVVAYPGQNGVVIRQQRASERDRDDVITIPHHAINRFIRQLQLLENSTVINAEEFESNELVEILAAE
ncbi:MAG: hypothetical protein WBO17_11600 [Sphingorhabdus sp.]